jgi:hypothetical protein
VPQTQAPGVEVEEEAIPTKAVVEVVASVLREEKGPRALLAVLEAVLALADPTEAMAAPSLVVAVALGVVTEVEVEARLDQQALETAETVLFALFARPHEMAAWRILQTSIGRHGPVGF